MYDYEGGDWTDNGDGTFTPATFAYHVSAACNHCAAPACVANCPQGALDKDPDTGLVLHDDEKCIGCATCVNSCPLRGARGGHRADEKPQVRRLLRAPS